MKNKSRLLSNQISKNEKSKEFCANCLDAFTNKKNLESHEEYCLKNKEVRIKMPEKGTIIIFKNHNRSIEVPFNFYADFESFIQPISGAEPNANKSFTNKTSKHIPCGSSYTIVCFDEKLYHHEQVMQDMQIQGVTHLHKRMW